jgi:ribonuclease-3
VASANTLSWAEQALGHRFRDEALLKRALTHASAQDGEDYERLEFLGDRVLGCIMADWLYADFAEVEGKLARRFAELVSGDTCAAVAREVGADAHLRLGRQARADGVAGSDNVLGDVCEALIGALYLDGGLEAARTFVRRAWTPHVDRKASAPKHPKSALQEWAAERRLGVPHYELIGRGGPHHAPTFHVRVSVRGQEPAEAEGGSKHEAERLAAQALLDRIAS